MATVDHIIERQHQLFGVITRAVENMKKLGPSKTNRSSVQSRIEALKANWERFRNNHEHLFKACSAEQRKQQYFKDDLYAACEEEFLDAHGTMLHIIDTLDQSGSSTTQCGDVSLKSSSATHSRRLPRIDLPKFSGDYSQWSQFRDLFVSMIVDNSEISAVEKLHYLKMSLSGEPAQHLKNIRISSKNFVRAWDMLIARYENKRILIDAQVASLFDTRKVKLENAAELKRLLGDVKEAVGALEALDCPVRHWDLLIIFLVTRKLDAESFRRWEETLGAQITPPSFADLESFIVSRICTLEAIERSLPRKVQTSSNSTRPSNSTRSYIVTASGQRCALCYSDHYIAFCPKYLENNVDQRRELVKSKSLCYNYLGPHLLKACRNSKCCRTCRKQHHSTLHPTGRSPALSVPASTVMDQTASLHFNGSANAPNAASDSAVERTELSSNAAQSGVMRRTPLVLLATAIVNVRSQYGEITQLRALLDQGSEASFISESASQALKLPRRTASIPILGIGAQRGTVSNGVVSLTITSRINQRIKYNLDALVLPKLTAYMPPAQLECEQWSHLQGLQLADPTFATPSKIDLILGANIYSQVLEDGLRRGNPGDPIAQKTTLGWMLSGPLGDKHHKAPVSTSHSQTKIGLQCCLDSELLDLLQRFWIQEEVVPQPQSTLTPEESQCEEHFKATHYRDPSGRFVVRLPIKQETIDYGDSRTPALKSQLRLEKRLDTNTTLKATYHSFLREYRDLDHMRPVVSSEPGIFSAASRRDSRI